MNKKYLKIPENIIMDKNISAREKILYGMISLMSHQHGYCYATNQFFADELHVTKRTITTLVSHLKSEGYIKVEQDDRYIRKIFINE